MPANQDAVFLHGLSIATESETRDGMSNADAVVQYGVHLGLIEYAGWKDEYSHGSQE